MEGGKEGKEEGNREIERENLPCVSVLVPHFLFHLCISEDLDGGPPGLCISQLPHRELDRWKRSLTEGGGGEEEEEEEERDMKGARQQPVTPAFTCTHLKA